MEGKELAGEFIAKGGLPRRELNGSDDFEGEYKKFKGKG
jgi:hypothetical protein